MMDDNAAAKVPQNQAPISRSIKSKLRVSKIGKEHIQFNKVFLICYINTQSGPYWVRVANYFQMLKKKSYYNILALEWLLQLQKQGKNVLRQEQIR